MEGMLAGKVALVTGAAAGIGRASLEYAKQNVRINAVCPGVIRTAMIDRVIGREPARERAFVAMEPLGRMGEPSEVGEAAAWLCSPRASFVTGHALAVDGGLVAG